MSTSNRRVLRLRYPAKCAVCFRALEPGTRAEWNSTRKVAICIPCTKARPKSAASTSAAGGSARAVAARRRDKQQAQLQARREERPVLEGFRQRLFPEADKGASWEKGAVGEELLAASLQPLVDADVIVALHDRRIPGSTANIDHVLVAANGVWVVDAKRYKHQKVTKDVRGGIFSSRAVLSVDGRDRSNLVDGVHKQVGVVRAALEAHPDVPVHGALCFVDGDWGLWRRPFTLDGVVVLWPRALRARLSEPGELDAMQRMAMAAALGGALPPAI
jgi:hypothetical protein